MDGFMFLLREFKNTVFSVLPLIVILLLLKLVIFRSPLESNKQFIVGTLFTIVGLFVFLQGAQMSLIPVAESAGSEMYKLSQPVIIIVAFVIGFASTLVEPALTSVTQQAENVAVGAVTARFLTIVTALGFSIGMVLAVVKIIYNWNFLWIVVPALVILAVLGLFCNQTFAAIAFDCAGATTGPVNIPVNLALALGLARTVEGADPLTAGFGIIGLTIIGVACAIMTVGLFIKI